MAFATSGTVVDQFAGTTVGSAARTHLLANAGDRKDDRVKFVVQAIRGSVKIHPLRLAKIFRRGAVRLSFLDLHN